MSNERWLVVRCLMNLANWRTDQLTNRTSGSVSQLAKSIKHRITSHVSFDTAESFSKGRLPVQHDCERRWRASGHTHQNEGPHSIRRSIASRNTGKFMPDKFG